MADDPFHPKPVEKKSKLKISNANSALSQQSAEKNQQKQWFEKAAEMSFKTMEDRKKNAAVVVGSFWNLVRNKELKETKGPNRLKTETVIFENLIKFAMEANQDEEEYEGQGSIYMITLLFKAMLEQKDRINELEFELEKLKPKVRPQ